MKLKQMTKVLMAAGVVHTMVAIAPAVAQETKTAAPETPPKVQKIEVTGTSIKRTSIETASPVQVITAADIERSGVSNMTELLQTIPSITSGGQNDFTTGNGFATGVATASLRGLGSASTLTLINGRRMAATATADPNAGQSTLYNINNIPPSAIARIEVVKDGASAVYGSDAIAGVVNIILKKEFKGLEASARLSFADQGGFQTQGASMFGGFGDFEEQKFNVMYGLDVSNRPQTSIFRTKGFNLGAVERANFSNAAGVPGKIGDPDSSITFTPNYWAETGVGRGTYTTTSPVAPTNCPASQISTTWLASGAPTCVMDLSQYELLTSPAKTASAFGRVSFNLGENLTGFLEAGHSRLENYFPSASGFATISNATSSWFDPAGVRRSFRYVMPATHPDNPLFKKDPNNKLRVLVSARLGDIPRDSEVIQSSTRLVGGFMGTHYGWDWQAGVLYNDSRRNETERGAVNAVTAAAALDGYRFGGTNSPEVLSKIASTLRSSGTTSVSAVDLKGSREFGQLAGGAIGVAAGVEARRESIEMRPDAELNVGNIVGRGSSSANGSRNVASFFTELNLPVLKTVNVEAAVRYDRYSDYGASTTPKLGFKWTPVQSFSVRGTVAEGFRAPALPQIATSNVASFQSISTWRDAVRCPKNASGVSAIIPGATGYESANECNPNSSAASRTISTFIIANPNLQPETSRSATLGLVFQPTPTFSGTLDFYQIRRMNEIDRFSANNILEKFYQNGESNYASVIFRSPDQTLALKNAAGQPIDGTTPIVGVKRQFLNLGESRVNGIDLELSHRLKLVENG
ncbi:TonB-dependent receptor plug domain-containing protein, partial [Undibacterium sp.]|uniref:TonB-dependent receptor plug domain-containing protein n=1 Tax=Undibacterium sp. TaxID=1914977 RepID=UPI0037529DA0